MNTFWKSFCASLLAFAISGGLLFILGIVVIAASISSLFSGFTASQEVVYKPQKESMLVMDFSIPIVESTADNPIYMFDITSMRFIENHSALSVANTIVVAAYDNNIESIFMDLSRGLNMSLANIDEVREAIKIFQEEGKSVYVYSDHYSQGAYYLASVADKIYLAPSGSFSWYGLSSTTPYFKELLDKFDINVEVFKYGKYKSAVEPYLLTGMSEENRKQTQRILDVTWKQMLTTISKDRNIDYNNINLMASGLAVSTPHEALKADFIDKVAYKQDISEFKQSKSKVSFNLYHSVSQNALNETTHNNYVEVIYADGTILSGESLNIGEVGDITLVSKIERATKDKSVKAIVLRVNSPGGSALASDIINRAVIEARKHKPIVVSMGDYAASGGYYIACNADAIVASPYTLTGSIGVFGLMFNASELLEDRVGVHFGTVKTNPSADMGVPFRKMTSRERAFMQKGVDSVYVQFVNTITEGREMSFSEVDKVAQGQVWSTVDAIKHGLVDNSGTLLQTIMKAADMADLGDDYGIKVRTFEDDFLSTLMSLTGGSGMESLINNYIYSKNPISGSIRKEMDMLEKIIEGDKIQAITPIYIKLEE